MTADYGAFVRAALLVHTGQGSAETAPPSFGALDWFVGMEHVEALDAKVRNLTTDVEALDPGPVPNPLTEPEQFDTWHALERWISAFRWQWVAYTTSWGQWMDAHYSTLSRTGEDAVQQFEQFQAQYNEFLRKFAERFPGETKAEKSEQKPGPAGELPSAVKWASAAVIAVVALLALRRVAD